MTRVPGGTEQDDMRFHHATQNGTQFKQGTAYFQNILFNNFGPQLTAGN